MRLRLAIKISKHMPGEGYSDGKHDAASRRISRCKSEKLAAYRAGCLARALGAATIAKDARRLGVVPDDEILDYLMRTPEEDWEGDPQGLNDFMASYRDESI